eukprot:359514-Chlamydomonas_euryale.AAC.2
MDPVGVCTRAVVGKAGRLSVIRCPRAASDAVWCRIMQKMWTPFQASSLTAHLPRRPLWLRTRPDAYFPELNVGVVAWRRFQLHPHMLGSHLLRPHLLRPQPSRSTSVAHPTPPVAPTPVAPTPITPTPVVRMLIAPAPVAPHTCWDRTCCAHTCCAHNHRAP